MITPMQELNNKSDEYIHNMLIDEGNHSKEYLQAAALIFEERNLSDLKKQEIIKRYPKLREDAIEQIYAGESQEVVLSYLKHQGVSERDSKEMIILAQNKKNKETQTPYKYKNNLLVGLAIIILYIIVKIAIKYFSGN